jgi:hypothetical protein
MVALKVVALKGGGWKQAAALLPQQINMTQNIAPLFVVLQFKKENNLQSCQTFQCFLLL